MSILVDVLAAWGALSIASCGLVVWWGIARSRRRERAAADEMALVDATRAPSVDAEIDQMIADYRKKGGGRA